jgi:hypothetical protein
MDNQIKTSFIPRKPLTMGGDIPVANAYHEHKTTPIHTLFSLVATVIFLAACLGYGGVFLWEKQLESKIARQEADMKKTLQEFDENFIKEVTRLDTRIKEATKIIYNHVSPSTLYAFLSTYTLETVSFSKFNLQDNKDGTLKLSGEGDALRYESIVLQSDEFGRSRFLRNVLFSDLQSSELGDSVGFTFEAQLDPRLILYRDKDKLRDNTSDLEAILQEQQ